MNHNNEKGYTLVSVLLVVLLLVILGGAYIVVMGSEVRQSVVHSDRVQAYYYARSGAEAASDWVIANHRTELKNVGNTKTLSSNFDQGNIQVNIDVSSWGDDHRIKISSTGTYRDRDQKVVFNMLRSSLEGLFDKAVFSVKDLDLDKAQAYIHGDVETKGVVFNPENVLPAPGSEEEPIIVENSEREYPSPDFPGLTEPGSSISLNNKQSATISSDGYYENISLNPGATLIIEVPENEVRIIEVGYIDSKGEIEIVGGGSVYMFVHSGMEIRTPHTESSEFVLVIADGSYLTVQTPGAGFFGYVYGPNATVNIQAHGVIEGAIIVDEVSQQSQVYNVYWKEYPHLNLDRLGDFLQPILRRAWWE